MLTNDFWLNAAYKCLSQLFARGRYTKQFETFWILEQFIEMQVKKQACFSSRQKFEFMNSWIFAHLPMRRHKGVDGCVRLEY